MAKVDRFRLHRTYRSPRFRIGATVVDEWRGKVRIVGLSTSIIPWPIGQSGKWRSLVVYGALARAIRSESVQAVAHAWGVTPQTVTKWRRRLGIAGHKLKGTIKLRQAQWKHEAWAARARQAAWAKRADEARCNKIAASKRGKRRPRTVVAALRKAHRGRTLSAEQRRKMSETHKRRGTRPPWIGRAWTAGEDQLVVSLPIAEAASRTGRSIAAVLSRRQLLRRAGIAIPDGRIRRLS